MSLLLVGRPSFSSPFLLVLECQYKPELANCAGLGMTVCHSSLVGKDDMRWVRTGSIMPRVTGFFKGEGR